MECRLWWQCAINKGIIAGAQTKESSSQQFGAHSDEIFAERQNEGVGNYAAIGASTLTLDARVEALSRRLKGDFQDVEELDA